jgi:DNA-binding GntR family transcriptional regulator
MEVDGHEKIEIPPSLMDSQGPSRGSEYELAAVDAMIESSEPGERGSAASLVEVAYVRLRSDVIHGALAPGEKLRIEELRAKYGLGATPLREALSRLSAVGLVEASAQRGFRVSRVSVEDLDDVTENRVRLECDLLRDSIAHGDEAACRSTPTRSAVGRSATATSTKRLSPARSHAGRRASER